MDLLCNMLCEDLSITVFWLFIKPGIQERGTECEECGERGECSLGFQGMLFF